MEIFFTILILIFIVSLSGLATRILPFHVPLPLIQISLGALLAWPKFGLHIDFNPELFLVLFIPPLLFSDGWKTPIYEFLRYGREIIALALMLVIITVIGIGYLIYWMIPGISLTSALALSAVLSPTDAVALSGIIGNRIPRKLMNILQGEALMNDASGLVALKFSIAVAVGTMSFSIGNAFLEFVKIAAGGLLIGIIVTWGYSKFLRFIIYWSGDDEATQTVFLLLLPFASYLIAEHIGVSGILSTVSSGMTVGQSRIIRHAPLAMRLRGNSIWSMLEFVFNGMVFIMLGLQLPEIVKSSIAQVKLDPNIQIWALSIYVSIIYISLITLRFIWLFLMKKISSYFISMKPMVFSKYSIREILITSFAGVRGAITLAGVLSIPLFLSDGSKFPSRYQLVFIATGVILFSLVFGVIILPILLKNITLSNKDKSLKEERMARIMGAKTAIESLQKMEERITNSNEGNINIQILSEVSAKVIGDLRKRIDEDSNTNNTLCMEDLERQMRLNAIHAERGEYYHLRAQRKISSETLNKLLHDLDLLEVLLTERK